MKDLLRPIERPEERYWRRQANRRVRKERTVRAVARVLIVLGLNLVAAVLVLLGLARFARHLTESDRFALREIRVEGTARTTPRAVEAELSPLRGRNILALDLDEVAERVARNPWVLRTSIRRVLPGTLQVSITERIPAAIALIRGTAHVVDAGGRVIGPSGPGLDDDLPVLCGLDRREGKELEGAIRRGLSALAALDGADGPWSRRISELDLSEPDRIAVTTREEGPRILLDPDRAGRNVARWLTLRTEIESRVGPVQTVDLRWSRRIGVLPAEENGEGREADGQD